MILPINELTSVLKTINRKNGFAPLVMLVAVLMASGISISYFLNIKTEMMAIALFILLGVLAIFSMGIYLFMLIKRPELLQSEQYRLEEKKLNIISEKSGKIKLNKQNIEIALTPELLEKKAIEKGGTTHD